jgi:hypothetical protein
MHSGTAAESDGASVFTYGILIGLPILFAILLPLMVRQARRARRYAAAHAHLLPNAPITTERS